MRPAAASDAAAITRIYNESLPAAATCAADATDATERIGGRLLAASRLPPLPDDGLSGWVAAHATYRRPLWVALAAGEPVGWLSLVGFSDRPACNYAAEVAIYVARAWQRRGVGGRLLEHALREAPAWDIDRLMAFIWHDNTASRSLFGRHGFRAWGSLPGVVWADAQSRDMQIYGRVLNPGAQAQAGGPDVRRED
ncbi:MAG TPA: GNAT family N-acetyltransferase [Roseateles sp.]